MSDPSLVSDLLTTPLVGDPGALSRRERRKLEVHVRILEAAVELFQTRGIEATRVVEICERADVARKTFFNHFASKRQLLREIARYGLQRLLSDIEEARKQADTSAGRIRHFFHAISANASDAGPMHGELLSEIVQVAHAEGKEPEQARQLHDAFGAIVADGVAAGDLTTRHSPETLTEMLMGAYYALMFNWANLPDYPLRERAVATARFLEDAMTDASRDAAPGQSERDS